MIKFITVFLILLACCRVSAQTAEIRRSADIVVIKGKSYYLHVVDEGQTLYSICKAYGIEVNVVKELNRKQNDALSMFEVLKIPYVEPYVEKDRNYYYHKVEKGETLYSISRKFGIKVKRILKENEQYEHAPLSIGAIVKLPLREIDTKQIGKKEEVPAGLPETENSTEEVTEIPEKGEEAGEIAAGTGETVTDTVWVRPAFIDDPSIPDNKYVKVALLLPLFAQENVNANLGADLVDTLSMRKPEVRILHKSEQFLFFYEGMLLAVDSLKNAGYKVDLHVFDTEKSSGKMYTIASELNELNPDIIIGPVYGSEFRILTESLSNPRIPIVYPLSSRNEDFEKYPNFIQVNASFNSLAEKMAGWISAQSDSANIVCVNLSKGEMTDEQLLMDITEKKLFTDKLNELPQIQFYKWDFETEQLEALKLILDDNRENIVVLPTSKEADVSKILPVLAALTDMYRITVVGFPDWQNFTAVDHETFYKLNVKVFTYSYIDPYSDNAGKFADRYRTFFYTEPHSLSGKAYDMGLYFIPLAAKYGERFLESIAYSGRSGVFSVFDFKQICPGCGWENRGWYIVNYGSDYKIKTQLLK